MVRERSDEGTEPRGETKIERAREKEREKRARATVIDGIRSAGRNSGRRFSKEREGTNQERKGERETAREKESDGEQEEARQGREEEPRPVCASASESD